MNENRAMNCAIESERGNRPNYFVSSSLLNSVHVLFLSAFLIKRARDLKGSGSRYNKLVFVLFDEINH